MPSGQQRELPRLGRKMSTPGRKESLCKNKPEKVTGKHLRPCICALAMFKFRTQTALKSLDTGELLIAVCVRFPRSFSCFRFDEMLDVLNWITAVAVGVGCLHLFFRVHSCVTGKS